MFTTVYKLVIRFSLAHSIPMADPLGEPQHDVGPRHCGGGTIEKWIVF
jgi:hypothetical protein